MNWIITTHSARRKFTPITLTRLPLDYSWMNHWASSPIICTFIVGCSHACWMNQLSDHQSSHFFEQFLDVTLRGMWRGCGLWWPPSFVTTFCNQRFASTKAPAPAHCIDSTSWQHMWQYNNLLSLAKAAGKRTLRICCALVGFALKMRCEHSLWVTFRHNAHFFRHEASAALTSEPQRQHGSTDNVALEQPKLRYRQKTKSNLNTLS